MSSNDAILRDARWLPHGFDPARRAITFIRIERERLSQPAFLADAVPASGTQPVEVNLDVIASAELDQAPLHFIFHTAFCRSTLLTRALEHPGVSAGLSEPGIIVALSQAGIAPGQPGRDAAAPVMRLLSRPWSEGEAVFVKPTNHANMVIPLLMDVCPDARAVLMTNPLTSFLAAIVRKGLLGRRWGRQLYLELMGYAGMDFGMDPREQFSMTDLQAGGLAWLLNQRYLGALTRQYGNRVRVLDGDVFGAEPAVSIAALARFTQVPLDADSIANGPVFARDAKTGEDYATKAARDAAATSSAVVEDEIGKVAEWIGIIARQGGIEAPLRATLV